jgi:outer membrane protein assembly factor BamB
MGVPVFREEILPGLGSGWPRFVSTPSGLVLVVLEGKGDRVTLVALETETGSVRWQRPNITIENNCGFFTLGSMLLIRSRQEDDAKAKLSKFVLTALDIRDGRELWRNEAIKEKAFEMLCLPGLRLLLLRTFNPGMLRAPDSFYALDLDTGTVRWSVELTHHFFASSGFPLLGYQGPREAVSQMSWWKSCSLFYQDPTNLLTTVLRGGCGSTRVPATRAWDPCTSRMTMC